MSKKLVDAAKAPIIAYNKKDWNAVRTSLGPGFQYDEVATNRKLRGADKTLACWQEWAATLPDSKATFHKAHASGNTVTVEVTWRGTHKGALKTPTGEIPATGKPINLRSCLVCEIAGGKAKSMRQYFDMSTLLQQLGARA